MAVYNSRIVLITSAVVTCALCKYNSFITMIFNQHTLHGNSVAEWYGKCTLSMHCQNLPHVRMARLIWYKKLIKRNNDIASRNKLSWWLFVVSIGGRTFGRRSECVLMNANKHMRQIEISQREIAREKERCWNIAAKIWMCYKSQQNGWTLSIVCLHHNWKVKNTLFSHAATNS